MTEQERQAKIATHKAERTKKILLQEAAKDLKKGKMTPEVYEIFKKKNS